MKSAYFRMKVLFFVFVSFLRCHEDVTRTLLLSPFICSAEFHFHSPSFGHLSCLHPPFIQRTIVAEHDRCVSVEETSSPCEMCRKWLTGGLGKVFVYVAYTRKTYRRLPVAVGDVEKQRAFSHKNLFLSSGNMPTTRHRFAFYSYYDIYNMRVSVEYIYEELRSH